MQVADINESSLSVCRIPSLSGWVLKPCPKNFSEPEFNGAFENYKNILCKFDVQTYKV